MESELADNSTLEQQPNGPIGGINVNDKDMVDIIIPEPVVSNVPEDIVELQINTEIERTPASINEEETNIEHADTFEPIKETVEETVTDVAELKATETDREMVVETPEESTTEIAQDLVTETAHEPVTESMKEAVTEEGEKVGAELLPDISQEQPEAEDLNTVEVQPVAIEQVSQKPTISSTSEQDNQQPGKIEAEVVDQKKGGQHDDFDEVITPELDPPRTLLAVNRSMENKVISADDEKVDSNVIPTTKFTQERVVEEIDTPVEASAKTADSQIAPEEDGKKEVKVGDDSEVPPNPFDLESQQDDRKTDEDPGTSTKDIGSPKEDGGIRNSRIKIKLPKLPIRKKKEVKDKGGSLDRRSEGMSFGTRITSAFGTIKRNLSQRREKPQPPIRPSRPNQPPSKLPVDETGIQPIRNRANSKEFEQNSLSSMSVLSNTPELTRKQKLERNMDNLMDAASLGDDGGSLTIGNEALPDQAEVREQKSTLLQVAMNISKLPLDDSSLTVQEEQIHPAVAERPVLKEEGDSVVHSEPPQSAPEAKPTRPTSKPMFSPIDYQHHQESENGTLMQQRIGLLQSMSPGSTQNDVPSLNRPKSAESTQVYSELNRPYANSLQRGEYSQSTSPVMRRAHTMRHMDYSQRIQERVKSIRRGPSEMSDSGTMRPYKPLKKRETYVCSDSFTLPKIPNPFKKRSKGKNKVNSSEVVIPRPMFQVSSPPPRVPRPMGPVSPVDRIIVETAGTQSSAPPLPRLPSTVATRQLTSLNMSQTKSDLAELPYVSAEIANKENITDELQKSSEAWKKTHEFLEIWAIKQNQDGDADGEDEKTIDPKISSRLEDFLDACTRLHSVDLEGQFAAFHYPLLTFDRRLWRSCATLTNWSDISVIRGPVWKTEYVDLPTNSKSGQIFYPESPIDSLLLDWFESHSFGSEATLKHLHHSQSIPVFHPVLMVASLDQLLKCNPYTDDLKNRLIHQCLRLAVLLSYLRIKADPHTQNQHICGDPEEILIAMSTSNCLAIFRQQPEPINVTENSTVQTDEPITGPDSFQTADTPVSDIFFDAGDLKEMVDKLIEEIYSIATYDNNVECMLPTLLKAIAPPDWMAILIARILINKSKPN